MKLDVVLKRFLVLGTINFTRKPLIVAQAVIPNILGDPPFRKFST